MAKMGITDEETAWTFFRQAFKFGCIGLLNAMLTIVIYSLVIHFNASLYVLGNVLAWLITVGISYLLNRRFVFTDTKEGFFRGLVKCYLAYLASLIVSSLLLVLWIEMVGISEQMAQIINIIFMVPVNFLMNKLWTFEKPSNHSVR